MATLTASAQSALHSGPSWDETIVPSLRKRLETESRILSKRLSTISITDEGPPSNSPHDRATSPRQNYNGDSTDTSSTQSQRPSAIPRPSYSSRASDQATMSPSPLPQPVEPIRKLVSKRQRTQSTPFPFDGPASGSTAPNGHHANGMPMPSSSGTLSIRVQSPALGRSTTPSRIPTVSARVRSGSQSSQVFASLNGAKASLPPSHKFSASETSSMGSDAYDSFTPDASLRVKASSASSSSLAQQRIVDERPPFAIDPSPSMLEREFTGRPSVEEERTFQHWYRGDVSRNGGVGEYRVGKRMEMLDIANYGHTFRAPAGWTRAHEEPMPHSDTIGTVPRKRAESVSSRERASIYIDPQDEAVTGRVLDEMPLTDIEAEETDYERDQYAYAYQPQTEFGVQNQPHQLPPTNHNRPAPHPEPPTSYPNPIPPTKAQTRIPQSQPRPYTPKESTAVSSTSSSEPSTPAKPNQSERGRVPVSANARSKSTSKAKAQKRSKSAADALRSTTQNRESVDYTGLADAVPDTRAPVARNGNWDEVILPTVARRMGIEYEKEDPEIMAKRKARESRIAPAPGTFGYDHTKYKPPMSDEDIPMDEFGQQPLHHAPEPPNDEEQFKPVPVEEPRYESDSSMRRRRDTMPSPAPFSHYGKPPEPMPASESEQQAWRGRNRRKERQDVPQILVSPPTMDVANGDRPAVYVEEEHGSGCCKCVVM